MSHSGSPIAIRWLRAGFVLLLLLLGYSVGSGIIYLLWSRLIGWPVVEGEYEVLLRLVHLLPAVICSALAGCIGGATNRMRPLFPAALLGLGIAVIHYASYSRSSRTAANDIVAAIVESLVLFVIAFGAFRILAGRRGRTQPNQ
jgi:NO-binding membrane sensor protein with MHYT domain